MKSNLTRDEWRSKLRHAMFVRDAGASYSACYWEMFEHIGRLVAYGERRGWL